MRTWFALAVALFQLSAWAEPDAQAETAPAGQAVNPMPAEPAATSKWFDKVSVWGFGRIGVFYTFPFQDEQFVGGNGGFRIADARLGLDFQPVDWARVVFSLEASAPRPDEADPTSGRRIVDLRDFYLDVHICSGLNLRTGQFRPAFYAEMLEPDASLPFVTRSVIAEGYNPPDAYAPRRPIVLDRQVGLEARSDRLGGETFGLRYALGVFNGNGVNALFNDNNAVTPVARLEFDLWRKLTLGLNAAYNVRADQARPNRVSVNQLLAGGDLVAAFGGFRFLGAFTLTQSSVAIAGLPSETAMGALGQAQYLFERGLDLALRYAFLEPSSAQTDDQVHDVSLVVGFRPMKGPVRIALQLEHRQEEPAASLPNDSVILFAHVVF